jgi:hypothetical protein
MAKGVDEEKRQAWVARLKRFRSSGLTIAKFCEEEKVAVHSYYYWVRRIAPSSTSADPTLGAAPNSQGKILTPDSRIHFQFGGGVIVSIPADCLAAIRCLVQCIQQSSAAAPASLFHQVLVRDAAAEAR